VSHGKSTSAPTAREGAQSEIEETENGRHREEAAEGAAAPIAAARHESATASAAVQSSAVDGPERIA
jgi:hypothetical protein